MDAATFETGTPMRVAIVTETYPPEVNGVAMTVARLVGGLRERGHQVQLVRPRQHPGDRAAAGEGIEELLTGGYGLPGYAGLRFGVPSGRALARAWRERPVDVVHIDTEGPLGWSALATARRLGLPTVTSFHTNFHQYSRHYGLGLLRRPVGAYLRRFHRRAQCTLVPTRELADSLADNGFSHIEVLGRGVDTKLFHPNRRDPALRASWGAEPDDPVALYVGRLAPEKNLEAVLHCHQALKTINPRARLALVGDGPSRARLERDHPEIRFCGERRGETLARHYASADLFLFPSLTETFGNVVLEALASGLPVAAYRTAAAREHVQEGVCGRLAPPGDEPALVAAAVALGTDPERSHLGEQARREAMHADWEQIHDRFEALLRRQVQRQEVGHVHPGRASASLRP